MNTLSAVLLLTLCGPAAAQMYPGEDITVNPQAAGTKVLLYPGGKYMRVQHQLLQPGATDPNAPIHLHMPYRHAVRRSVPREPTVAAAAPPPQPTPQAPMPASALPDDTASRLTLADAPPPAAIRQPVARRAAKPKPMRQASASPPPNLSDNFVTTTGDDDATAPQSAASQSTPTIAPGLSRRSAILFSPGAPNPLPSALDAVKSLADELNASLTSGASRIELQAYGGAHGDKSSDARRLSLRRALIIRQILIDDGVPSERIDVRAMGGAENGPLDRVDVFVRA